jgi:hypothetical protein
MTRALAVMVLCTCALPERDVLSRSSTSFTNCDDALTRARVGELCVGLASCARDNGCCREALECTNGIITSVKRDCTSCPACEKESDCNLKSWCLGNHCEPCPLAVECPPCPAPFVQFVRNGCATCECGPPSNCEACSGAEVCRAAQYCVDGCVGEVCCVQRCSVPLCSTPNPEGCSTDCGTTSCGPCVARNCQCAGGTWVCERACAPEVTTWSKRCRFE